MAIIMSKDVIKRQLKTVPLFSDLASEELDALASVARPIAFRRKTRIFEEGSPADCCFVLTSGRARIAISGANGTEILRDIVGRNQLVGEVALLERSTRSASFVAVEDCRLIRIPASVLHTLRRNPQFEDKIVVGLAAMLRKAEDQVRVIATFPCAGRVAWCLGRIAGHEGWREGPWIVIPSPAHQELAEMTGCTRETVSRVLGELEEDRRLLMRDRRTIRLDADRMQRFLRMELTVPTDKPHQNT